MSIAAFLKFFPQYSELYKKYSKLGVDIVEQLDKKTKDNTLSEKQSGRLNWKQVKALWYRLGDIHSLELYMGYARLYQQEGLWIIK